MHFVFPSLLRSVVHLLMLNQVVSFLLLNLYLYLAWSLHSIINAETVSEASLASLLLKRNTLFEELEYFLNSPSEVEEGSRVGNQLACRVSSFFFFFSLYSQISTTEIL